MFHRFQLLAQALQCKLFSRFQYRWPYKSNFEYKQENLNLFSTSLILHYEYRLKKNSFFIKQLESKRNFKITLLDSKALAIHFAHFLYIKAHYVVHSSLEEKSIPEAKVTSVNLIMIMEIFLLVLAFTGISIKCEGNTKLVFFFTLFFRNTKNYRLLHVQSSH